MLASDSIFSGNIMWIYFFKVWILLTVVTVKMSGVSNTDRFEALG